MIRTGLSKFTILITCLIGLLAVSAKAQLQDSAIYPVVIQFNSFGTGVPDDSTIRSSIVDFKKKNKLKTITAIRIGPMGKEGEYWLAFSLDEINKKHRDAFCRAVKAATEKHTERGSTVFVENMPIKKSELSGRVTIEKVVFQ